MTPLQLTRSLHLATLLETRPPEDFDMTSIHYCAIGHFGKETGFLEFRWAGEYAHAGDCILDFFGLSPVMFCYAVGLLPAQQTSREFNRIYGEDRSYSDLSPADVAAAIRQECDRACAADPALRHANIPEPLRTVLNSFCPEAA